jgi:predicted metalloprotease with PDZ domain
MNRVPYAGLATLLLAASPTRAHAQNPLRHYTDAVPVRAARAQPVVHYVLSVSDADTTGFDVQMTVRNAPDSFRVAMAKHPEYDERFFRFVRDLRVVPGSITRQDSAVWRVMAPGGSATISYRIQLPASSSSPRGAWRPFLSPTGGLTGGTDAFMYVVGAELAPSHVVVRVPQSWSVATGLTPTSEPRTFFAASVYELVESPILVGRFRSWGFPIDGVPHTIAYWPHPNGTPFDTATFRNGVERMTNQVVRLFGRPAYREYLFQFQDNAFGGLEHHNSVSLGAPSAQLARNPHAVLQETAHEFFHTWNLMRIRPAEYVGVDYRQIQPVPTLWFSEGLTLFYADLLLRRAGLPTNDSSRTAHLENLIARYAAQPGTSRFSAEQVSRVAYNAPPDALGDYGASTHLQGEVIGAMLDLVIRDATNGRRSMDDVMRLMLDRFSGERGFTTADVERAVADICACKVKPFFDAHVRGASPIAFDRYLGLIGLRAVVTWDSVLVDGRPAPDRRLNAWNPPGDSALSLLIGNPSTVWGRAGLHSGDLVVSVNGVATHAWPEFRQIVGRANVGDTVRFVVRARGATAPRTVGVVVTGYERPVVRIQPVASASQKQRTLHDAWAKGTP